MFAVDLGPDMLAVSHPHFVSWVGRSDALVYNKGVERTKGAALIGSTRSRDVARGVVKKERP